jgi:hypothetical protein
MKNLSPDRQFFDKGELRGVPGDPMLQVHWVISSHDDSRRIEEGYRTNRHDYRWPWARD